MVKIPDEEIDIYHWIAPDGNTYDLKHSQNTDTSRLNNTTSTVILGIERRIHEEFGEFAVIYALYDMGFITTVINLGSPQIKHRTPLKALGILDTDQLEQLIGRNVNVIPFFQMSKEGTPRITQANEQFITFIFDKNQHIVGNQQPVIPQQQVQGKMINEPTIPQAQQQQGNTIAPESQNPYNQEIVTCFKCKSSMPKSELVNHLNQCTG